MKKHRILCWHLFTLIVTGPYWAQGEPPQTFNIRFHGYIHPELFYDSRQMVSAREGNVVLYPSAIKPGADGSDLNAHSSLTFSLLSSRFGATIHGPDMLNAKTSAMFEIDILGSRPDTYNLLRMRHAYIRLNWETTELLAGQYWHPLFITSCFPGVISFGAGVPYHILNRGPQLRVTRKTELLTLSAIMISQNDYISLGPSGGSSSYIRNSGKPEVFGQLIYEQGSILAGFSAGYKWLRPRTVTPEGYLTRETMKSFSGNVFARWQHQHLSIKLQGLFGEEMSPHVMLGGYGEAELIDPVKGIYNYAGIRTLSSWIDLENRKDTYFIGFFAAYSKNLGTTKPINGDYWARGANIASIYRISPRAGLIFGKTTLNLELLYDVAAYGQPDKRFQFDTTESVGGVRILTSLKYSF